MSASADALHAYLRAVESDFRRGNATEHTYRHSLQQFIQTLDASHGIVVTNEPKRAACGAPDFLVSLKSGNGTLGYVEAKDIGISLDEAEKSEQLRRYRRSLPNLLLTDYLEFRWYVEGELRGRASLACPLSAGKLGLEETQFPAVLKLLTGFLQQTPTGIDSPDELARRMARLTHLIRDLIVDAFGESRLSPALRDWHEAFQKTLLPDLSKVEFADMFAQTLAYGLFSARIMFGDRKGFNREEAQKHIPKTNPFLRQFFYLITGPQLDDEAFAPFVEDIVQTLRLTDINTLLQNFGKIAGRADPMLHFYETFLAAYDQKLRELRGVYYTPPRGSTPGRVRINETQGFENVPPEAWAYHVGGYQVCEKWLKDRKGRQLTIEERRTYPQMVSALAETIRIQREIDEAIASAGGWPLK